MSAQTTRRILIGWLVLVLLFAQGLRLCTHDNSAPHVATHSHDAAATHFESTLSLLDGHGEAVTDTHVTLVGILKNLAAEPLFAALFITLLFILPAQQFLARIAHPRDRVFHPPHGYYASPPLRAPPR